MSYVIPDPRFEAPELFDPGRKPIGNVVVDWGHKLVSFKPDDVEGIWFPRASNMRNIALDVDDLTYNQWFSIRELFETVGHTNYVHKLVSTTKINNRSDWTLLADVTLGDVGKTNICGIQEAPNHGTQDRIIWVNASGQIEAYIYDGTQRLATSTKTYTKGDRIQVIATCTSSQLKLFIDGALVATTAINNAGYNGYASPEFGIGYFNSTFSTAINFTANYHGITAFMFHAIPDSTSKELSRNIYGFLIPA